MTNMSRAIQASKASVIYKMLRANAAHLAPSTHSEHDWGVDLRIIKKEPERPFVHVTYQYGTAITCVISALNTAPDVKVPFLFGEDSPRGIHEQYIKMYLKPSTEMFDHPHLIQTFDGNVVKIVKTPADAADFLKKYRVK